MVCFKQSVVFHQRFKRHRLKPIQIDAGVQHVVPRLDTWPEVHVRICVDMTVNHI